MAGMVHQKVHGEKWSNIPTSPAHDDIKRYLRPVSTAATLNLAAAAAQAARLWRKLDPAFSARCLTAAETAFAAAKRNPAVRAEHDTPGGGAYGDGELGDEFYWAAAELFVTTGKDAYQKYLEASPLNARFPISAGGHLSSMNWQSTEGLGMISMAIVPGVNEALGIQESHHQFVIMPWCVHGHRHPHHLLLRPLDSHF